MKTIILLPMTMLLVFCMSCSQKKRNSTQGDVSLVTKPDNNANIPLDLKVARNIAYYVILQTYMDLAQRSEELVKEVDIFSKNPTGETFTSAQKAWRNAREPWESSEGFLFGPVESLGIDPLIDQWPIDSPGIDLFLKKGTGKIGYSSLDANLQGFHAVEYLLFGKNGARKVDDISDVGIEYLQAISQLLAKHTQRLAAAWEKNANPDDSNVPGYVVMIMNPRPDNIFYPSVKSVLAEYLNGIIGIVDEVKNGKIADPMGADISSANIMQVESQFSGNSLVDFANNIESVRAVYTGDYKGFTGPGLDEIIRIKNPLLADRVLQQIDQSISAIHFVSDNGSLPFRQAIFDNQGRRHIDEAIDQLQILFSLLDQDVRAIINQ